MDVTLGDLADKLSIALRKQRIIPNSVTESEIEDIVQSIFVKWGSLDNKVEQLFIRDLVRLCDINYHIWHLEAVIRNSEENELSDEFVGKRAKIIRDLNKQRVGIRDRINSYVGDYKIVNV